MVGDWNPLTSRHWRSGIFTTADFHRSLIPLRVEEHTAQLDSIKGQQYQDLFRNGDINVLSCSTTFELGIDLGDLQAVVMSNIPPDCRELSPAGRSRGAPDERDRLHPGLGDGSPHDQTYFSSPGEIIHGQIRVPHLALENPFIRQRHVYAVLLSAFLRHQRALEFTDLLNVGAFFDEQFASGSPHANALQQWLSTQQDEALQLLASFGRSVSVVDPDD